MRNILKITILIILFFNACQKKVEKKVELNLETQQILSSLNDKIYINIYLSGNISPQFNKLQDSISSLLHSFQDFCHKELDYNFIEINNDQNNQNSLIELQMYPIWVKLDSNYKKTFPFATIHYKNKSQTILLHNSIYLDTITDLTSLQLKHSINQLEYRFIESIYILHQKEKQNIAFLQGHSELDSNQAWDIANTLEKYYNVDFFDLRSFEVNQTTNSPDLNRQLQKINNYKTIIIAKPKSKFLDIDKYLIDQYIMHGGRILWLIDGTTANINSLKNPFFLLEKKELLLGNFLSNYGAKINHDLIMDEFCSKIAIKYIDRIAYINWKYNPNLVQENHVISKKIDSLLTNFTSSIDIINKETTTKLLSSSINSKKINLGDTIFFKDYFNDKDIFSNQKLTTAVLIEDEFKSFFSKDQYSSDLNIKLQSPKNKMIIVSDGDIISNLFQPPNFYYPLGYYQYGKNIYNGNTNFILNCVLYLCDDENLIKIKNQQ
tara:strand:+ start:266 stop:1741 length:1476 start_codon:yes stop_codon:yes gene_type:complete